MSPNVEHKQDDDARRAPRIDEIDETIISLLQEDGRRTYGAISRLVGLSEAATRQRVNRLRDNGTLRIVAVTDPISLGLRTVAMAGIKVVGDVRRVAERLASVEAIEYVVLTAGSFDILVEIVCENERRLLEIIVDEIRAIDGVTETETFIYLHIEKQVFAWGGRTDRAPDRGDEKKGTASRTPRTRTRRNRAGRISA